MATTATVPNNSSSGFSTNRIPVQVNHGNDTAATNTSEHYFSSSRTLSGDAGGGGGSAGGGGGGVSPGIGLCAGCNDSYDMRNLHDETDRIKSKMRDFEERCKRWREDFFIKNNHHHHFETSSSSFDQRVPPASSSSTTTTSAGVGLGQSVVNDNNNNNLTNTFYTNSANTPPPFASSLHKSYIEDLLDGSGGKKYKIEFEIGDFQQNELQINTQGRTLIVKGDRELKAGSATETKTFNRELTLPDYVDLNKMNAYLIENNNSNQLPSPSLGPASAAAAARNSQLISPSNINNILVLEAPILMEKYSYRRSAFDKQQTAHSPTRIKNLNQYSSSPSGGINIGSGIGSGGSVGGGGGSSGSPGRHIIRTTHYPSNIGGSSSTVGSSGGVGASNLTTSESHHSENKTSSTSTTHTRVVHNGNGNYDETTYSTAINNNSSKPPPPPPASSFTHTSTTNTRTVPINDEYLLNNNVNSNLVNNNRSSGDVYSNSVGGANSNVYHQHQTNLLSTQNQSIAPELIAGYPIYDNEEGCVLYKFDLSGFDQSEIHLTITVDRTLEIKACKETTDHFGKVYREFKREIQLDPDTDANQIKNLLFEGILTLKIPKPNRQDGLGSLSNSHNLHAPNGFQEIYTDDGKLAKLTSDLRGYNPENVKIVLSANNILKVLAQQLDSSPSGKGTVQKECTRQYTLPNWIQPEQMRAVMSKDGILTIDFTNKSNLNKFDERIHIN